MLHDLAIQVKNYSDVTIMQLVRLVNRIFLDEDFVVLDNNDLEMKSETTSISSKMQKDPLKNRCYRCKLIGHYKGNCTARIYYCQ